MPCTHQRDSWPPQGEASPGNHCCLACWRPPHGSRTHLLSSDLSRSLLFCHPSSYPHGSRSGAGLLVSRWCSRWWVSHHHLVAASIPGWQSRGWLPWLPVVPQACWVVLWTTTKRGFLQFGVTECGEDLIIRACFNKTRKLTMISGRWQM